MFKVLELAEQLNALAPDDRARLLDREMAARVRFSHVIDATDDTMVKTLGALFGHLQVVFTPLHTSAHFVIPFQRTARHHVSSETCSIPRLSWCTLHCPMHPTQG